MTATGGRSRLEQGYTAFLERVILPAGDLVLRTEFMHELRRWRKLQTMPAAQLEALQRNGLALLLEHATTSVPYYRDLDIAPTGDPHEWLHRYPVLTKDNLRNDGDRLCALGHQDLVKISSSGSSGVQSTVWTTQREISRSQAIQTLWWEWAGYRLGARLLQTGMTPDRGAVKALKDKLLRTSYIVAFGLTDAEMVAALEPFVRRPGAVFGGYASSLDAFARAAADADLGGPRFSTAMSWGDKLYPHHRRSISSQFGAPAFDSYGTGEGMYIAAQRSPDGPYYVMSPHVVVELLDDADQPVPAGEMGRVVVTRLDGFAMPLIRFALGDLAVAPKALIPDEHALAFPQLERIVGRETDVISSPRGRTLTVHTFTGVLEHFPTIRQFSVVPVETGLVIEYIPAPGFEVSTLTEADAALTEAVGETLDVQWREVEEIPDAPSGKPQIIRTKGQHT